MEVSEGIAKAFQKIKQPKKGLVVWRTIQYTPENINRDTSTFRFHYKSLCRTVDYFLLSFEEISY